MSIFKSAVLPSPSIAHLLTVTLEITSTAPSSLKRIPENNSCTINTKGAKVIALSPFLANADIISPIAADAITVSSSVSAHSTKPELNIIPSFGIPTSTANRPSISNV